MMARWLFATLLSFGSAFQGQTSSILSPDLFPSDKPASKCLAPEPPQQFETSASRKSNTLSWQSKGPAPSGGYRIYLKTDGKLRFRAAVGPNDDRFTDSRLVARVMYCYAIAAWNDCDNNGSFKEGVDQERRGFFVACSTPR